uniref:Uncharacterized protein n=1 Tax=Ciona savignyi TaxID=51511 RepID=H2YXT0_CIOSA
MVLIPVNAYVRPGAGNHINQSMGLAFAVQAHSLTSNVGTVIPIRNNTVVTGACQQQLIILNSSYSQAGMTSCTNLPSTKQSINTTIVYPPNMATATISQQSSTKHLTTTTQSKSILLKNNTTNIVLTPPPTSNNVRKIQKHNVNNQTVMLNAPSNASTGNVTSAISNAHSSTSQPSTNVVDSTPTVKSDSRYKIHSIVDERDKLKQVVNQLSQTSGGISSTSKKSPRSRNSSIVIPPA